MTAKVITLPIAPRPTVYGDLDTIAISELRISRAAYGRLMRLAQDFNVDIRTAAEMLLMAAVNEQAGIERP